MGQPAVAAAVLERIRARRPWDVVLLGTLGLARREAGQAHLAASLFRDVLDRFTLPGTGFPLGFWFAQQGAIVIFVLLIGVYVILASRLDATLEVERNQIAFDLQVGDDTNPEDGL